MAKGGEHLERVEVARLEDWRAWLAANHAQTEAVWVVTFKKGMGPYVSYGDVRDEALCWGWIDSLRRTVDDDRTRLLLSPRRTGSRWSAVNKVRVDALLADGRMQPAGLTLIEAAKADGTWDALNEVEALIEPDDLMTALEAANARATWDGFSRSARRGILEWIFSAKRPDTRQKRVTETARLAALGLRAGYPEAKGR